MTWWRFPPIPQPAPALAPVREDDSRDGAPPPPPTIWTLHYQPISVEFCADSWHVLEFTDLALRQAWVIRWGTDFTVQLDPPDPA
jgi:hypothetical protein